MEVLTGGGHGLFDRDAEVATIEAAVARAAAGDGGVLVVRGPAGIGKSALLRVGGRLAEGRGLVVLRARGAPFERGFPFGMVRQLFEPVLAHIGLAGDVSAPAGIELCARPELAADQVHRPGLASGSCDGRLAPLPAAPPGQTGSHHQAGHSFLADVYVLVA